MAANWSSFMPDLAPHLPGCPSITIEHELLRAAQEFFERTRAWKVTLDPIGVGTSDEEIDVVADDGAQAVVQVEKAWYDGKPMDIKTHEEMDANFGDDWYSHTGTPSVAVSISSSRVRLYPLPVADAATGIRIRVSVKPSDRARSIPDDMASKFREALLAGAKSKLMLYPEQPFSNPKLGVALSGTFEGEVNKATAKAATAYGRGRIPSRSSWC